MEVYRSSALKREQVLRKQIQHRHEKAWQISRLAAQILKSEFGVTRVVVFGSLLQPTLFHLNSDIDLAIWDVHDYFRAVSKMMDLDPDFRIDLVPIEDARVEIRSLIEKEGLEI
jgi:predicted nucleotidyltransferase